jgi:hypothetical protein
MYLAPSSGAADLQAQIWLIANLGRFSLHESNEFAAGVSV